MTSSSDADVFADTALDVTKAVARWLEAAVFGVAATVVVLHVVAPWLLAPWWRPVIVGGLAGVAVYGVFKARPGRDVNEEWT